MCRSVPHNPAWDVLMSTSPGPSSGSGTWPTRMSRRPYRMPAFIYLAETERDDRRPARAAAPGRAEATRSGRERSHIPAHGHAPGPPGGENGALPGIDRALILAPI